MSPDRKCTINLKKRNDIPRLTAKGLIVYCANSITNVAMQKFDWADALVDAAIISGLTFFSSLGGGSIAGLEVPSAFKAAAIAGFAQFFVFLALKRGIVQSKQVTVT